MERQPQRPRILIFSHRNLSRILPYRCPHFEFEDVISEVDSAEVLAPSLDPSTSRYAIAKQVAYHTPLTLNPGVRQTSIKPHYELFLAICGDPTDLLWINAIRDWRARCKTAVCLIDELWVKEMACYRHFLAMLEKFDVVMLYYSQSVEPLNKLIGHKCVFLPPGVDAIRFCPYPQPPRRVVDIYSMGRRSDFTHRALLRMAEENGMFYLFDSIVSDQVLNAAEHRGLFANIAKRSRYFIVNPGLIDRPDIRGGQIEIGNRYFEAAAAGAIMVGERPKNPEFCNLFDWPDSLIDLSYNSPDIKQIVNELDRDPERQDRMRRANVKHALLRHDWLYRWEVILKAADLKALPQLLHRKATLQSLAAVESQNEIAQRHSA